LLQPHTHTNTHTHNHTHTNPCTPLRQRSHSKIPSIHFTRHNIEPSDPLHCGPPTWLTCSNRRKAEVHNTWKFTNNSDRKLTIPNLSTAPDLPRRLVCVHRHRVRHCFSHTHTHTHTHTRTHTQNIHTYLPRRLVCVHRHRVRHCFSHTHTRTHTHTQTYTHTYLPRRLVCVHRHRVRHCFSHRHLGF